MSFENFDIALEFLNITLKNSLEKLLIEAKRQNCILSPYGRPPTPSPFVNENEINIEELLKEDIEFNTNDRASFNYNYGFNPLIYLSELILKSHPRSIEKRKQNQILAVERLTLRSKHAQLQLNTARELKNLSNFLQSGIAHGPLTTPISSSSVLFWCRTVVEGDLVVQLAKNSSFTPVLSTIILHSNGINEPVKYLFEDLSHSTHYYVRCYVKHLQLSENDNELIATMNNNNSNGNNGNNKNNNNQNNKNNNNKNNNNNNNNKLNAKPSQNEVEENDESTVLVPDDKIYGKCQFWTLMAISDSKQATLNSENHENPFYPLEILVLSRYPFYKQSDVIPILPPPPISSFWNNSEDKGIDNYLESTSVTNNDPYGFGLLSKTTSHPIYTCYVGDILTPSFSHLSSFSSSSSQSSSLSSTIWSVFNEDILLSSTTGHFSELHNSSSPLSMGSMFLAWNDNNNASDTNLKAEEVIYKQWSYDNRKYEKKLKERNEKEKAEPGKHSKRPLGPPPTLTRPPMTPSFNTIVKVIILIIFILKLIYFLLFCLLFVY